MECQVEQFACSTRKRRDLGDKARVGVGQIDWGVNDDFNDNRRAVHRGFLLVVGRVDKVVKETQVNNQVLEWICIVLLSAKQGQ